MTALGLRRVITEWAVRRILHQIVGVAAVLVLGCYGTSPAIPRDLTKPPLKPTPYSAGEALKKFDQTPDIEYRLGEGDVLTIQV
jgi:hypothetical protein